jgi:NitT/TauT family transport system substrate-binding protein
MNWRKLTRRKFLGSASSAGLALIARPMIARADAKEVLIAEPVHSTGYLPLYIGMAKNLFDDVKVNIVTIESGGGHTNAVLSGQAFAFIGGPEHDAYAKAKGAELRAAMSIFARRKGWSRPTPTGRAILRARRLPSVRTAVRRIQSRGIC